MEEAEESGVPTVLIDGPELAQQMMELGMGVRTVPITRQEIDHDFFDSFKN